MHKAADIVITLYGVTIMLLSGRQVDCFVLKGNNQFADFGCS